MLLAAFAGLPLLPPPLPSNLSATEHASSSTLAQPSRFSPGDADRSAQSRQHSRQHILLALRNPNSLHALARDEALTVVRKTSIQNYGNSWLRPAGVAKTMLGQREEAAEREEVERQMREQEEMEEDGMRQDALRAQMEGEQVAGDGDGDEEGPDLQRDLDDDIPDADADGQAGHEDDFENHNSDGELNPDDEVPDGGDMFEDEFESDDVGQEEEADTSFASEIEGARLEDGSAGAIANRSAGVRRASYAGNARHARIPDSVSQQVSPNSQSQVTRRRQQPEQETMANAMRARDELLLAPNLEPAQSISEAGDDADLAEDLDNDIPEASLHDSEDGEDDWQHTDTELELEDCSMASVMQPQPEMPGSRLRRRHSREKGGEDRDVSMDTTSSGESGVQE